METEGNEDQGTPSYWLSQFLATHPDGDLASFDSWVESQVNLEISGELWSAARTALIRYLSDADLLAVDDVMDSETENVTVFGSPGRREGAAQQSIPALENLRPGRRVGGFVLERFIARGGMGQVWVAEDVELRRQVALKLILPERVDERSLALFAREARAGGRLRHPNLVTTLGHGTDGGLSWIAQELIEGSWTVKDSIDSLRAEGIVPRDYYRRVAELVVRIADGMQAVHDAGVIHRDLKPQNILVDEHDQPKVTDFGLASITEDSFISKTGDFGGTWAYMSPEQVTAKRMGLDHRTDVFSLGVVMYELLTLRRPFEGDTVHQVAAQIIGVDPPLANEVRSQCPRELAVICAKAMEKFPDRRYASMADLAADLRRHLAGETVLARPAGPLVRGAKWARRHPTLSSVAALASLALVAVSLLSVNLARQTVLARKSQERLALRAEENARLAEVATRRAEDVLSLSATKDLEDLVAEAEALWPAHPELLPSYERWLASARLLRDGQPADEATGARARPGLADHEAKLSELLASSRRELDEARLELARGHESYPLLERTRAELLWTRRMLGQAEWPDPTELEQTLDEEDLPAEVDGLLNLAWSLVQEEYQVTRGWLIAGRTLEEELDASRYASALVTLAWAEARLGREDRARANMDEARAELAASSSAGPIAEDMPEETRRLEEFLAGWQEDARPMQEERLRSLEVRVQLLEVEVGERSFDDSEDAWWVRQLAELVEGIRGLHDPVSGLAGQALAEPFGWGISRRVDFARTIEQRSTTGARPARLWSEARAGVAASEHYGGLELEPQLGLLPLGPDPDSGLWEFAHLASGEPAIRGEDGALRMEEETGIVFVLVPAGSFWMGAQAGDPEGRNHDPRAEWSEAPVHEVRLSAYLLSKYEMTQGQWLRATAARPSYYDYENARATLQNPVEEVSWLDCTTVTRRLGIELPTEAQWEYGCRAGTSTPWWFGANRESVRGAINIADMSAARADAAWPSIQDWPDNDDGGVVHMPAGTYAANAFGLHEVHGNVGEWCRDSFDGRAYERDSAVDPVMLSDSNQRISRGGSYYVTAALCRASNRDPHTSDYRASNLGLRPAMTLERLSPHLPPRDR